MKRPTDQSQKIHKICAALAILCVALFFSSTIIVELLSGPEEIARVKQLIVFPGLFILIPAIATTGISGFLMAGKMKIGPISTKKKRMPVIGMVGLLVLVPCAIVLNIWASAGQFDQYFYIVQVVEILAGGLNLTLMILNAHDGRKLKNPNVLA